MRSTTHVLLVAMCLAVLAVLPTAPAAASIDASAETEFACLINAERVRAGRPALRVATDLRDVARGHSVRMADANRLYHNPNLSTAVRNWSLLAENVGRGVSVSSLHRAFMDSSGHRANILDDRVGELGIGVEVRGSTVWVTEVFRRPSGAAAGRVPDCGTSTVQPAAMTTAVPDGGTPITGDWNGDGRSTPGTFVDGWWYLSNSLSPGADVVFRYGQPDDIPIVGDWNGNGRDTVGIVRDGEWHLRNRLSGGRADLAFVYGRVSQGDVPIVGDWNGNGRSGVGIIRDGTWHLRNTLSGGRSQISFTYGRLTRGDLPLVGDWNGNGRDTIGIVRSGEWHLRNGLSGGPAHTVFVYGRVRTGDEPVIGDWNRDGRAGVGIVRSREWHLRNSQTGGAAETRFVYQ